jgi:hypothetical protein
MRKKNFIILIGILVLCIFIIVEIFFLFLKPNGINFGFTFNKGNYPTPIHAELRAPNPKNAFNIGEIESLSNNTAFLFTGRLQNVYKKNNQLFANVTVANSDDSIEKTITFLLSPSAQAKVAISEQLVNTWTAPSTAMRSNVLNQDQAAVFVNGFQGSTMIFLVISRTPQQVKPGGIYGAQYFLCNQSLVEYITSSFTSSYTCNAYVNSIRVYVTSF